MITNIIIFFSCNLAVDGCATNGVTHALEKIDCNDLPEKEECRGEDKEFCDCCKRAVLVRDSDLIQRDPQSCASSGAELFSGECLEVYIHCCTGQGISNALFLFYAYESITCLYVYLTSTDAND